MRALVTGGAGFIGSHLVDALVRRGDEVVVLDDLSSGRPDRVPAGARLEVGSIVDFDTVRSAAQGCEVVFHQAALRSVPRSVESPIETDRVNAGGTLTVLTAARDAGVRRMVAASSSSVYGGADLRPTPEDAPLIPRSPYAVSKLAGEHHCRVFAELFGLETVSLRYFNVYGPWQDPASRYAAVVPLFIAALADGVPPIVHGDGLQSRDFTYVTDAVAANLRAAEAPADRCAGKAYNVAGGDPWTLLEVLGYLGELIGVTPEPEHTASRAGDVRHTHATIAAATEELEHVPVVPMKEGLASTVSWFLGQRSAPRAAEGVEVTTPVVGGVEGITR